MKLSYEQLEQKLQIAEEQIEWLKDLLKKALERIAELEEKLNRNSKNSSKPPSTDQKSNTPRTSSLKRKAHEGKARALYPQERVDQHIDCTLECCPHCQSKRLELLRDSPLIWQQAELPTVRAIVTQFNRLKYRCETCGIRLVAHLPEGVPFSAFGPKLMALVSHLTGNFHLAKREAIELIKNLYEVDISEGSVANIEENVSDALDPIYERIHHQVVHGILTRHFDETSWRDSGKRNYVWIATNTKAACYRIDPNRSQEAFFRFIGTARTVASVTDRYNVYNTLEGPHQYCLAHLIRDFHSFAERKGEDGRIGAQIEKELRRACGIHDRWRDKKLSDRQRRAQLIQSKKRLANAFDDAIANGSDELAYLCLRLDEKHLWAFISTPGMEPTNNIAERDLRKLVLWRKKSYGTRSARGKRFVERITSVVETLKKNEKVVFKFLEEAMHAFYHSRSPPLICPEIDAIFETAVV